jgi:hypothetical protein
MSYLLVLVAALAFVFAALSWRSRHALTAGFAIVAGLIILYVAWLGANTISDETDDPFPTTMVPTPGLELQG